MSTFDIEKHQNFLIVQVRTPTPYMKFHSFRQDLQDYQDLFWTRISLSCPSRLPGRSFLAKPG
jgi:hypothetical protein